MCFDKVKLQPTVLLECGHALHAECLRGILNARWSTARITFGFMGCPLCKVRWLPVAGSGTPHWLAACLMGS